MHAADRDLVIAIKALYEEHDRAEQKLLAATRHKQPVGRLWRHHDLLERTIVHLEAKLPPSMVERLKAGEL